MIKRILFYFFLFLFIHILPSWNYEFESCCSNEKTTNNTTRLLSCPLNFVIKLRSAIFYTGNGCSRSECQKRLNKYYLSCNNHRTCSISIRCILMDSSTCPWLEQTKSYSQHLIIDYDCILHKSESSLIILNNQTKKEQNKDIVLFSAKINIESPLDSIDNDSFIIDNENEWKEYFLKKYFHSKPLNEDKAIIIHQQRSLFNEILRTIIILIIFTFILILFMIITLFIYKHITLMKKKKFYGQDKHRPFPSDDAYDNLKATRIESASETGTTTDV
ncbi:unnamed protein product [Rotaria sordida]|uniref:Uncharacterized protein n=1 Tax=Rotaria sordida TaxID=392033 RepID=A0A815A0C3_9BILA|nr:unnamed protein product [Rotaria sordida]CAF1033743.1 unnamed protein product [Rotaria sordida]CAF1107478.1 unnamed protein product [Rotaria sordida]CAF1223159.1 unnamed protein product [Rotaria sordida]CAF1249372.1 unnamed protein product [Rotaria sordida]